LEEVISMHMADALISPAMGGALWTAGAALTYYSAKKIGPDFHAQKAPLMGVLGAFVFAAQMINFAIPGTGSSGHLGGGLMLSVLLGPYAGFLTMASILTIQALLFADGGLLALGCNIVNLAFFPCFIAYPLIYRKVAGDQPSRRRIAVAVTLATVVGLQLGALGVVAETLVSSITELPFQTFTMFMLPIHLVIGLVEAAVTTAVLWYVRQEAPGLFSVSSRSKDKVIASVSLHRVLLAVAIGTVVTAGMFSWFASSSPDGLEWAIQKTAGRNELENSSAIHTLAGSWQKKIALFPDYQATLPGISDTKESKREMKVTWPAVSEGNSVAGLIGSTLTLVVAGAVGAGCRVLAKRNAP
jgi:cobalt/nickel transport system permease protein